ncbi:MAG TPA: sigma-70 family RNA polymerase sigma factor [Gemmatimonadales bacterium]|jgi:RNA polymerase sigma-70 factor (ECF subfamily)|nr:sigma-70 family RNA polymerase sigma factor [Gemmatimonadales bacterium]
MAPLPLTSSTESDRGLLDRVARGEEAALERLYDTYASALYALAYRIAGERSDAEEIVLDSFAQVWRDARRFRAERGSVIAWLTTICRSRALDLVRARGRRARLVSSAASADPEVAPAMGSGPGAESEAAVEGQERSRVVAEALRGLSVPQRQAIELAYYAGLSHSEIAERLGEPLGTVKTRVRLAMERLREVLRPYYLERSA